MSGRSGKDGRRALTRKLAHACLEPPCRVQRAHVMRRQQADTGGRSFGHWHTAHRNNPDDSNAKDQQSTEDLAADRVRVDVMLGSPISRRLPRLRQLSSYSVPRRGGCLRLMRRRWAGEERLSTICYAYWRPRRHPRGLWRSGRLRLIAGGSGWLGEQSAGQRPTIRVLSICVYSRGPRRHLDPRHRCRRSGVGRRSCARMAPRSEESRKRAASRSRSRELAGVATADDLQSDLEQACSLIIIGSTKM